MIAPPAANRAVLLDVGCVHLRGVIPENAIAELAALSPSAGAATRLPIDAPIVIAAMSCLWPIATDWHGATRAVRCVLFDKSAYTNWLVPWHQDRAIAVSGRVEVDGFGPWSIKQGIDHVEPPFMLLAGMITMRLHIDDCPVENAPLLAATGTHRQRYPAAQAAAIAAKSIITICTAAAGNVWLYSTPIIHAAQRAQRPSRRRVLQIDFCASLLPPGLDWAA